MIKRFYFNHFSAIETLLVTAITGTVIYFNHKYSFLKVPSDDFLYALLGSVVGLLGFVIAFTAIIFSLHKSEKLNYFQGMDSYKSVFPIFTTVIKWMTLVALSIIAVLLINYTFPGYVISGLVVFSALIMLVKISRCIWVTKKMFDLSADV